MLNRLDKARSFATLNMCGVIQQKGDELNVMVGRLMTLQEVYRELFSAYQKAQADQQGATK